MEKEDLISSQMSNLQEFLRELLMFLPGKELGENVVEFQRFLKDVGLGGAIAIDKSGEIIISSDKLQSVNLPEVTRKILNYLGGQMSARLSNLFVKLFISTYKEIKSGSKPAADIWLSQIIRDYGGLLAAYDIMGEFAEEIELPPIFSSLRLGSMYLLKDEGQAKGYEMIKEAARYGFNVCCISKLDPNKIKYRHGMKNVNFIWLTFNKAKVRTISPDKLGELKSLISNTNPGSAILIDCLKEIILVNGFEKCLEFLKNVMEICRKNRLALIISIKHQNYPAEQLAALEQEMEEIKE